MMNILQVIERLNHKHKKDISMCTPLCNQLPKNGLK